MALKGVHACLLAAGFNNADVGGADRFLLIVGKPKFVVPFAAAIFICTVTNRFFPFASKDGNYHLTETTLKEDVIYFMDKLIHGRTFCAKGPEPRIFLYCCTKVSSLIPSLVQHASASASWKPGRYSHQTWRWARPLAAANLARSSRAPGTVAGAPVLPTIRTQPTTRPQSALASEKKGSKKELNIFLSLLFLPQGGHQNDSQEA